MPTKLLYLTDSYLKTATAKVTKIESSSQQTIVSLDQTIFYPQGGGQPADIGDIIGKDGILHVSHVSYNGGDVQHKGKLEGSLQIGEQVTLRIDWTTRFKHMQWHTAGHLVDQAVKNVIAGINGVEGEHGIGKKLYIEFDKPIAVAKLAEIQTEVDTLVATDLAIVDEMVSAAEIAERGIEVPFALPKNKPLRLVTIGNFDPMPDGGTQLKSTGELEKVTITTTKMKGDHSQVIYQVGKVAEPSASQSSSELVAAAPSSLAAAAAELKAAFQADTASPDELKTKYLGKKGLLADFAKLMKDVPPAEKRAAGMAFNELKIFLENGMAEKLAGAQELPWLDVTLPGIKPKVGHLHPTTQAMEEITHIFEKIGFTRARYPEVDWDWYVFEALNMPPSHPARDEWETFFVDAPANQEKGSVVLTTHTSNGQVHEMERLNHQPPIRMINIARCYRRQQDATHTQMFHQFEGLVVDKGINIQHLKGTLDYFAQAFFGPGTKSRIRPFHFQFTEPSFEVDFSCHICHGTGQVKDENGTKTKCKFCKSGWHEVGGAGMVHPNVLKAGGIDAEEYTGFAFGWGVERTYSLKEGLAIDDIRLIYSGELGFLEQF